MAYKALEVNGLAFDLIRSDDIRNGRLAGYGLLFVPGGWASNKMKALGDAGIEEIRRICPGRRELRRVLRRRGAGDPGRHRSAAGKEKADKGAGAELQRADTAQHRLSIRSGKVFADPRFHAWWPSQFVVDQDVSVLATYGKALPESFSSDLNVGDTEAQGDWAELERIYQINLDPQRLLNEPAVVEGRFGIGKVLLSLVHFDTPDDMNGAMALKNLWGYLLGEHEKQTARSVRPQPSPQGHHAAKGGTVMASLASAVDDLIELGQRNFLWFWRNPLLLQWRRGVRGLEYCTLSCMVKELSEHARQGRVTDAAFLGKLERVSAFADKAKQLLVRERYAMQNAHITYERCDDPEIQALREELFSRSKSHGGLFKEILDDLDQLLYDVLICNRKSNEDQVPNL